MFQDTIGGGDKNGASVTNQTSGYIGTTTPTTTLQTAIDTDKCIVPNNRRNEGFSNGNCYHCTCKANRGESFVGPGMLQAPDEYYCKTIGNAKCLVDNQPSLPWDFCYIPFEKDLDITTHCIS